MFSLNLYGTFVLTMSKKSYFIKLGSPLQTALKAVSSTPPWKKHMFLHHRLLHLQSTMEAKLYVSIIIRMIWRSFINLNVNLLFLFRPCSQLCFGWHWDSLWGRGRRVNIKMDTQWMTQHLFKKLSHRRLGPSSVCTNQFWILIL